MSTVFRSGTNEGGEVLRLEDVWRSFPGGGAGAPERAVLRGVTLALAAGEAVALVGRSGSGKTTLLYLAAGLYRPSRGAVRFEGRDLAALAQPELSRLRRRGIAMVFQNNLCLSAVPVWENVALPLLLDGRPARSARGEALGWLERVGLAEYAHSPTATLSGGQRRRMGLARAMAAGARLLLVDEPTADLDETTAGEVEELMFDWLARNGRSALIVTHAESIERRAHRVVRLEEGRVKEG